MFEALEIIADHLLTEYDLHPSAGATCGYLMYRCGPSKTICIRLKSGMLLVECFDVSFYWRHSSAYCASRNYELADPADFELVIELVVHMVSTGQPPVNPPEYRTSF